LGASSGYELNSIFLHLEIVQVFKDIQKSFDFSQDAQIALHPRQQPHTYICEKSKLWRSGVLAKPLGQARVNHFKVEDI
jgi:hypothetical protein